VIFDELGFGRTVSPPGQAAWQDQAAWADIVRVCVETEGLFGSDSLHVFTRGRPASYQMPLAAESVRALMGELIRRGLLDGQLAVNAALTEGLHCWPPDPSEHP
jgi:hypothetical protein